MVYHRCYVNEYKNNNIPINTVSTTTTTASNICIYLAAVLLLTRLDLIVGTATAGISSGVFDSFLIFLALGSPLSPPMSSSLVNMSSSLNDSFFATRLFDVDVPGELPVKSTTLEFFSAGLVVLATISFDSCRFLPLPTLAPSTGIVG